MALDTSAKRFSMINMASGLDGCTIHLLFEPDGSVDADDRASLLDLYNGIPLGGAAARTAKTRPFLRNTATLLNR